MRAFTLRRPGPTKIVGRPKTLQAVSIVLLAVLLAVVFGLASAVLPWWMVTGAIVALLVLVLALSVPELGIVGVLVMMCGVVPRNLIPTIKAGGGQVPAYELAIALLMVLVAFRFVSMPPLGRQWRAIAPVLGLLALVVSAVVVGRLLFDAPMKDALSDARNHVGWLLLPAVVVLVRTPQQITRMQWGLIFVGATVAIVALIQFVTGWRLMHDARVEELANVSTTGPEVIRSIVGPGIYFVIFGMLFVLGRLMTRSLSWWLGVPLLVLLLSGIVVSFGRGVWITGFLAIIGLAFLLKRWRGVFQVSLLSVAGLAVAISVLALVNPNVVDAAADRLLSTGAETFDRNTTLGWRLDENQAAIKHILSSPVVGIGMGSPYKPLIRMNGFSVTPSDIVLTRYIHNAYLGLWLKLGVLGPVLVGVLIWGYLRRGALSLAQARDAPSRVAAATMLAAFMVPVVTSITQPEWLTQTGIAFFVTLLGLQLAILRADAVGTEPTAQPKAGEGRWPAGSASRALHAP